MGAHRRHRLAPRAGGHRRGRGRGRTIPPPIGGCSARRVSALLVRDPRDQAGRHPGRIAPEPLDELGIPQMVQVGAGEPVSSHLLTIAAGIVIVGSVKGLMHVADDMEKELQRDKSLLGSGRRAGKLGRELVDLVDNARVRGTSRCRYARGHLGVPETALVEVRAVELDVDEMPLPSVPISLPRPIADGVSIPVNPCRFRGDIVRREVVVIGGEHRAHFGACCRLEILLGNQRNDLMTFVAPSCRSARQKYREQNGCGSDDDRNQTDDPNSHPLS